MIQKVFTQSFANKTKTQKDIGVAQVSNSTIEKPSKNTEKLVYIPSYLADQIIQDEEAATSPTSGQIHNVPREGTTIKIFSQKIDEKNYFSSKEKSS